MAKVSLASKALEPEKDSEQLSVIGEGWKACPYSSRNREPRSDQRENFFEGRDQKAEILTQLLPKLIPLHSPSSSPSLFTCRFFLQNRSSSQV